MHKFDWLSELLNDETIITKEYKNTQNVRRYFQSYFDAGWKNTRKFMVWFKENEGKTLKDAVAKFRNLNR